MTYLSVLSRVVVGSIFGYTAFLAALVSPWFQREALYLHRVNFLWWSDPKEPTTHGFNGDQVYPFLLKTTDGETLFAWHILPSTLYRQTAGSRSTNEGPIDSTAYEQTKAFATLRQPSARVIISFHGNAGHVAQGNRPDHFRSIVNDTVDNIHIVTFDYRGFGYSTGLPSEQGLIIDGISAVNWVMAKTGIDPSNIVLFGHSLGTAVASAVYHHFTLSGTRLGGLALVAAFTDVPNLTRTYRMGGAIPILAPLALLPSVQTWFASRSVDTWQTMSRLREVTKSGHAYNIHLHHSKTDWSISCLNSYALFNCLSGASGAYDNAVPRGLEESKARLDSGKTVWRLSHQQDVDKIVQLSIFQTGFHNQIMAFPEVAASTRALFASSP